MEDLTFFVAGSPHPQPRPAIVRATGHVYYPDKAGKLKRWVGCIGRDIPAVARFGDMLLSVSMTFWIERPDSHLKKSGDGLTAAGRKFPVPPFDLDNYAKCVLDTMQSAGVFEDDRNVIDLYVRKRWCGGRDVPSGCMVTVSRATATLYA